MITVMIDADTPTTFHICPPYIAIWRHEDFCINLIELVLDSGDCLDELEFVEWVVLATLDWHLAAIELVNL